MSDIFKDNKIYPFEGKLQEHFKDYYDSVFIAFLSFFQVERQPAEGTNLKRSKEITLEEAKLEIEELKDILAVNATIFSYSNNDYPSDEEIFKTGKVITWNTIINDSGLKDYSELNKALRTSIAALRKIFQKPELTEKLNKYTDRQNIWHPEQSCFDVFSKKAIYKTFKLFGLNQIVVTEEFYEKTSIIEVDQLTEFEFCQKINYNDKYLYSANKEVLFTIEWDSFFFLIATDSERMNKIIEEKWFEGFLCTDKTENLWDYEEGEFQKLLDLEEEQNRITDKARTKKQWWKFWN